MPRRSMIPRCKRWKTCPTSLKSIHRFAFPPICATRAIISPPMLWAAQSIGGEIIARVAQIGGKANLWIDFRDVGQVFQRLQRGIIERRGIFCAGGFAGVLVSARAPTAATRAHQHGVEEA